MPSGWRIVSARYAAKAFTGDGARLHGGRWNSSGVPMVYLAAHQSLAVLEILANARPILPTAEYLLLPAAWEEPLMERLPGRKLPVNWRAFPPQRSTTSIGDLWVKEMRSAVLAVPNVLVPSENNYLINPAHPDFRRIRIRPPVPFQFDDRLLG